MKRNNLLIAIGLISFNLGYSQSCKEFFKTGNKLIYSDGGKTYSTITIKRDFFIEKFNNSNKVIKSKIIWIDSCSFKMIIEKTKGAVSLNKGQSMTIVITSISEGKAYYKIREIDNGTEKYYIKLE